uniref:Si:ch73-74h11.1 n=1 Tax=Sinocyclocheilus anshuiensis TaxID=1608454 RepID=A0A671PA88_9TELE
MVEYGLSGHGADKAPYNLFVINPENGYVRVTGLLDREKTSLYNMSCAPCLANSLQTRNPVMRIVATDADEPDTINSKIAYSLLRQTPAESGHMFSIDKTTGIVYVQEKTLDRERHDTYTLIVLGVDMNGAPSGNTGTGMVQIHILDINDNVPTLEKEEYSGGVDEGVIDVVVMRIKALDKDLEFTDNWLAVFDIHKGNEDNLFTIETDPKTNEGILKLVKVNPDKKPTGKGYPVKISVNNQPDGPSFSPSLKDFPVSEDSDNEDFPIVLGTFAALDGDTGEPAENVRYTKGHDPDNWLTIDEETAEIKLAKAPDRESKFLVNGTYFAKIIYVPAKTVTGTIALKVEDSNDHCPTLTSTYHQTCDNNKVVNVTAFDEDADPNGAPYQFVLIEEESVGQWEMVSLLFVGTTVSMYKLIVKVSDAQGLACPDSQKFEVEVCTCEKKGSCGPKVAAQHGFPFKIGTPAFGFSLSGAVLLLLVPFLLIFCQCGTVREFTDLPFDAKESLIAYHTEGIGEDKEVPLLSRPVAAIDQKPLFQDGTVSNYVSKNVSSVPFQGSVTHDSRTFSQEINDGFTETDSKGFRDRRNTLSTANQRSSALYSTSLTFEEQDIYEDMAVRDAFLSEYFSQKVSCLAANPPLTDGLLLYEYEGQGTPAGSVGRCSLLESDNDLEFLNNLGSKFLTLAELCHPPKPSLPPPKTEQVVKSDETSFKTESSISTNTTQITKTIPPPQEVQQSSVTKVETVNKSATLPSAKASQTLFVQQQPLFYLVEQHIPNTVFVESPTQGLYKVSCLAANPPLTDGLLLYEYEGQGTPAGSVGRCSLLESDYDLEFLNNLGSKFLTLAELCHPPKPSLPPPKTEQVVKSDETSFKTESSISTNTTQITKTIPPPQEVQQSSVTKVETVNKSATLPSAKASQTLFVQQQPLFYLVEQHIPNTVFVESPTQGLYVINGKPGTEGLILQGGNVSQASLSRGQQAMYVINGAPVADIQPIQLQTAGQEQEAAMGCSPVSSPIGSPGGVLLMPMQFHENAMQGVTGTPPILLADVPTLSKQKKKKIPSETLGTKGVDPKVKDTAASK